MKYFYWPGVGRVSWYVLVKFAEMQVSHGGLRLANNVTMEHINFTKRKMNVRLCLQLVASKRVVDSLNQLHDDKAHGFDNRDTQVTARCIEILHNLTHVMNTKKTGKDCLGPDAPIRVETFHETEKYLTEGWEMLSSLTDHKGVPLWKGSKRTAFLGFLGNIMIIRCLVTVHMKSGILRLEFLLYFRCCQDELEARKKILDSFCPKEFCGGFTRTAVV